ncbi:DUF3237 domain protein [Metarhizium robertsii]|uniref:DUF3237 domain protein n=1 Tax=Metarhizium robertsii TaxID=568076 RepID=A0A014N4S4_9HYPO|nr:DUF3237 domain protein [Metarhizium robertsii]
MSSENTGFPSLQPAFTIKVGGIPNSPRKKFNKHLLITSLTRCMSVKSIQSHTPIGTIKSLPGFKPKVDAEIMFGGDWLYFDTDKSRTRINFKVITKTKSGAPFSFYYAGIVTIDEAIGKTFAYSPDSNTIPFGNSNGYPRTTLANVMCQATLQTLKAGNGRFILGGEHSLTVESRISKVVPSTPMD